MPAHIESKESKEESNIPQDLLHALKGVSISPCEIILPYGVTMESGGMGTYFRVYGIDLVDAIRAKFGFAAEYYPDRFTVFTVDWMKCESEIKYDDPRVLEIIEFLCGEAKKRRVLRHIPRYITCNFGGFHGDDDIRRVIYFRASDIPDMKVDGNERMLRMFERVGGLNGVNYNGDNWGSPIDRDKPFYNVRIRDVMRLHDDAICEVFPENEMLVRVIISIGLLQQRDALRGPMEVFDRTDATGMLDYLADRFVEFIAANV